MLTIIHGDDIVSSRNYYISKRQQIEGSIILYGESLNMSLLMQVFQNATLFDITEKNVFLENFFQKKENKDLISYLQDQSKKSNIFIWECKELSKANIGLFKNPNVKIFLLPKTLFVFLNELKPNNSKKTIVLFHKALEQAEEQLIFFMLVRHFRLLLAIQENTIESQIDEIKRLASWQKSRLSSQAKLFSKDKLKKIFGRVLDIDIAQKTGKTGLPLVNAVDFLLLSI